MSEEKLTEIIGIRVFPSWKKQIMEEAIERGEILSDYIYDLIETGREQINKEIVKQDGKSEKSRG
jgi:hypothetical protein